MAGARPPRARAARLPGRRHRPPRVAVLRARLRRLSAVLSEAPVLDVDRRVAGCYGELCAATGRLPTNDLWVAATALAHDLTLVTADERQAALPLVRTRLVGA